MTTRDQVRRAVRAERGEARPITAEPAPGLPERLLAARERKGVDLYRAERDTKIRVRYLAALERGDYRELPGNVYTKGFLRNYALYLGLDPDDVLLQWRRERGDPREPQAVITVPRPIATPRKGLTFSPSLVVFALLSVAVLAFAAYLGVQLLRFAKPPTIAVTAPAAAVTEVDESATEYLLKGTSAAGATINIATPGRDPYSVSADADGDWSASVELRRGRNQFEVSAVDPDTGKQSEAAVSLFIEVPYLVFVSPTLSIDQPAEGATFENGAIPVQGRTTNADSVVVSAAYSGPGGAREGRCRDTRTTGRAGPRHGPGRRGRHVHHAIRADGRQLGDHRDRLESRGQDLLPQPRGDGRLQGRQPRRVDRWWPCVDQGLGRRQDPSRRRRGGPGLQRWQDPDLQRQEVDRGSHGLVGRDEVRAQRDVARGAGSQRDARDLAVRATRQARADPASLTDVPPTDEELLDLAERVGASCRAGNRTLATAESCTGGLVAHLITEIPGSSAYFVGGLVTYDNDVKTALADVPAERP